MGLFSSIVNKVKGVRDENIPIDNSITNTEKEVVQNDNFIVFNAMDIKNHIATIIYKIKEIKINGKSVLVLSERFDREVDGCFIEDVLNRIDKDKCIFNLEHLNKRTYIEDDCSCPLNSFPIGILTVLLNPTKDEIKDNLSELKKELFEHFTETSNNFIEMLKN